MMSRTTVFTGIESTIPFPVRQPNVHSEAKIETNFFMGIYIVLVKVIVKGYNNNQKAKGI